MTGPLDGLKIVEVAGIGPAPFAAMMLADHGAEVIRIERAGMIGFDGDPLRRSRRSIALDLKNDDAREIVRRLAAGADGLIEGYRPGVMERLGLGPDDLLGRNPKLVYGRVTGWGQDGPLSGEAGHDVNFVGLSGLLHGIGPKERPVVPVNYLADFAGGGMMLAFGMAAALLAARRGEPGQVVDAAMTEGAALIGALTFGLRGAGMWKDERESNLLDGGSANYAIYECADGRFVAVGALEPQFRKALLDGLGLPDGAGANEIRAVFAAESRDHWVSRFAGKDACVSPVLDLTEAPEHPQNEARGAFIDLDGIVQPAPAPRYSRSAPARPQPPRREGEDGDSILSEIGYSAAEISALREAGALL